MSELQVQPTATTTKDLPPLTSYATHPSQPTYSNDRLAALRLITDSIAQQRQLAARAMIFHPFFLGAMLIPLGIVFQTLYKDGNVSDLALVGTTGAGCVMAGLVLVRLLTGGYLEEAERVGREYWEVWNSTSSSSSSTQQENGKATYGSEDEVVVLVTKFGEDVIGTVAVVALSEENNQKDRKGSKKQSKSTTTTTKTSPSKTARIQAWTVKQRYRSHGVGMALLADAVKVCREQGWEGPVFDSEHANSKCFLPAVFNGRFEKGEKRARSTLEKIKSEGQ